MTMRSKRDCLAEIYAYQADFDRRHGWLWEPRNDEEFINNLLYLGIALAGEVGELCNQIKKVVRYLKSIGNVPAEMLTTLKEELVDIFVYVIKGASQLLKMDLIEEYFKKMKKNEERFRDFEK